MKKTLICFLGLFVGFLSVFGEGSWTNSRGGQRLPGVTTENIPLAVRMKWTYKTDKEIKAAPVVDQGRVVVGSTDGVVYCFNFNGKLLWKYKTDNAIEAPALILNKVVYVGNLSGNFYAIDLITGKKKWVYPIENQIMGAANWWSDGTKTYILVGGYDYKLHCLNAADKKVIWTYETTNYLNAAIGVYQNLAVFGGCDGNLHVVNIKTGKKVSATEVATYVAGSVALENGLAYIADYDGKVTCFDLMQKKVKWFYDEPDKDIAFIGSPSVIGNRVLAGCRDRYVYCLNKTSGKLLWRKMVGNPVEASLLADARNVLVCTLRGDMLLLNQANGNRLWLYEVGSAVLGAPAVVSNHLFFGALDGTFYCLTKK